MNQDRRLQKEVAFREGMHADAEFLDAFADKILPVACLGI